MRRAHGRRRDSIAPGTLLAGILLALPRCVFALNPALDVSQYAHTAWTVREGFSKGTITAIAQTQDGYLWLGSEFGLHRFDGVRSVAWDPPGGEALPSTYIRVLLTSRDGGLWIGTSEGLVSWKGGKLTHYEEFDGQSISALAEDHEGTVWAGGHSAPTGALCAIRGGDIQCYGQDGGFGQYVDAIHEDRAGNLWVGGLTGLWRWKPGPPKLYPMPDRVQDLFDSENGALGIAMLSGIRQFAGGKIEPLPVAATGLRFAAREILRDRDSGLWIGTTDRGLVHVHQGRTDVLGRADGLSSDFTKKLFEDREGNLWVATLDGLDRFREFAVPTISVEQGLSNATVESVLVAKDGSVWLGTADGLNRWSNGRVTVYHKRSAKAAREQDARSSSVREIGGSGLPDEAIQSLFQDARDTLWVSTRGGVAFLEGDHFTTVASVPGEVHSIAGDAEGNVWIGQDESLYRLRDGKVAERIPWSELGHHDGARTMATDPANGSLWLGFRDGGVGYFKDGQLRKTYTDADGLGEAHVRDLQFDRQGTLWVSTENGLSRFKNGRFVTFSRKNGLPCDSVHWAIEDDDRTFWLYTPCGLVRVAKSALDAFFENPAKAGKLADKMTVFDTPDGVRGHSTTTGYSPSVAKTSDGKLWFLPWDGVSVVDPRRLSFNQLPPPVQIEQITADGKTYRAGSGSLRLAALSRDLVVDYTALSLVAPEKVLFRYRLDGWDRDWQDVGNRRQAFYSNLSPSKYTFRVMACNNSGVWSEAAAVLTFSVAPAFYQTTWFRLSCVAAFLVLLGALYQLRLRQIARQFSIRMEERVGERNRIAQELHDTLLQGFLSASMHIHVAADRLPEDSPVKPLLARSIQVMSQVIEEGRNALRGLRASESSSRDLEQAFSLVRQEFGNLGREDVEFRIIVDGKQRPLHPSLGDEVYRIGREALLNAFRHSKANHIELELNYSPKELRLFVRDDGEGIDPDFLTSGRDGHWGLSGMRERADRIGAQVHVLSRVSAGTEVELTVPGHLAFKGRASRKRRWFGSLKRPENGMTATTGPDVTD